MLNPILKALPTAVSELGATLTLRKYHLQAAWETVVGPAISRQSEPTSLSGEVLWVRTASPIWSQELQFRQGDILPRLNKLMYEGVITKIRCRVGRLTRDPAPISLQPLNTDQVDWQALALPAHTLQKVARIITMVEDPQLARSFEATLLQIERRRLWSYRNGLRPCIVCEDFQEGEICLTCEMERLRVRQRRLFILLGRKPWATYPELKDSFPDLTFREFQLARKRLRSLYETNYRVARKELQPGDKFPQPLRDTIMDLIMMSTGMNPENLKDRHFYHGLGKIWGKAYLQNIVPDLEAMNLKWKPKSREERFALAASERYKPVSTEKTSRRSPRRPKQP